MSKREIRTMTLDRIEIRADEGDGDGVGTLSGHAAVFNKFSDPIFGMFLEKIAKGAFSRAIKEKQDVRALINHDDNLLLGRTKSGTLRLAEDDEGLSVDIDLPDTTFARDLAETIRRGDMDQMSFSFIPMREEWASEAGPDGEDVRTIMDVDLFDVSPVTFPAYPDTDVAVRKHTEWRKANGNPLTEDEARAPASSTDVPTVEEDSLSLGTAEAVQRQAEAV